MIVQHSGSERGVRNLGVTWKNIVTDYGATEGGSGTSNGDYNAFKSFHDWAVEQSGWVGLVLPPTPGSYYGTGGSYASGSNMPFFGIPKLIVMGYGAAMNGLHGGALVNTATGRAAIYSADAGDIVLQLKSVDDAALFEVGRVILLAGLDLQGGWGYPPNSHYNEWHRIASIDGDLITLQRPIKYSYKDNWPRYFEGHEFELGGFGPATICRTIPGWDCEHRIYGVRSYKPGQQTYYFVRKAVLIDVKSSDNGWITGASEDHQIIAQEHETSLMEVDKLATKALITEYGPSNRSIVIQSSSVDEMHVRGGTRSVTGTARHMVIEGGNRASILLGPTAYGISESIEIKDAVVTSTINGSPSLAYALGEDFTYEGDGVFRYTDAADAPPQWFVPGAVGVIRTASPFFDHHVFNILGVRSEDGEVDGPILIDTDIEGEALPAVDGFANVSIMRHSAPNLTVVNCSGCPAAEELSLVPANSPFGIFSRRTYDGANGSGGYLMGRLVHLKINVVQPYTGVASNLTVKLIQFGYWVINADKTVTRSHIRVNCKIAGERIITPEGVTGEQSGDVALSDLTGGVWIPKGFGAFFGAGSNGDTAVNVSGEDPSVRPIVTIECLTDQEF